MKKAIIYTRAKIYPSDCCIASLTVQRTSCKEFADKNDLQIIGVRSDIVVVGTNCNFEVWNAIVNDSKPYYDCILVHSYSRIGRDLSKAIKDRAILKERGVRVISVTESGTEQEDDFMLTLMEELQKEMQA